MENTIKEKRRLDRIGYLNWMHKIQSVHQCNINAMEKGMERVENTIKNNLRKELEI